MPHEGDSAFSRWLQHGVVGALALSTAVFGVWLLLNTVTFVMRNVAADRQAAELATEVTSLRHHLLRHQARGFGPRTQSGFFNQTTR
jgi:hypothetical protein